MSANTQQDLQKMQRDAEQRIREMQRRSERAVKGNDTPPVPNFVRLNQDRTRTQKPPNEPTHNHPKPDSQHTQPSQKGGLLSKFKGLDILKIFNFKNIHIDNDVLIIIALIFLLSTEETDELLLLALIYIML